MKKSSHTRSKLTTHLRQNLPIVFAGLFGLVALAVGIAQISAQSPVAFLFEPPSQSANAGESRSVGIRLNNYNQPIDGGSVAVTYDQAMLEFVSFAGPVNPYISVNSNSSTAGRYSFNYFITNHPQDYTSLGTITFRTKSVDGTRAAYLRFDGINTVAYSDSPTTGRTYHPVNYGQGAIVITASSTPTPAPTPTPTPTPTPVSTTKKPSPPAAQPPAAPTPSPQQTPVIQDPAGQPPATQSAFDNAPAYTDPNVATGQIASATGGLNKPKKNTFIAGLLVLLGAILLLGSAAILFIKYNDKRNHGSRRAPIHHENASYNNSIIDDSELIDENIIITPEPVMPIGVAETGKPHIFPAIIKGSLSLRRKKNKEIKQTNVSHVPPDQPIEKAVEPPAAMPAEPDEMTPPETPAPAEPSKTKEDHTITQVKERTDKAHHKEVEVDFLRVKPDEVVKEAISPPVHKAAPQVKTPEPSHPKPVPAVVAPPEPEPPQPPAIPHAPHRAPTVAPLHKEPKVAHLIPDRPVPEWQTHLTPEAPKKSDDDNPPDMFELAAEHPETFGSYQAFEAEEAEGDRKNKK